MNGSQANRQTLTVCHYRTKELQLLSSQRKEDFKNSSTFRLTHFADLWFISSSTLKIIESSAISIWGAARRCTSQDSHGAQRKCWQRQRTQRHWVNSPQRAPGCTTHMGSLLGRVPVLISLLLLWYNKWINLFWKKKYSEKKQFRRGKVAVHHWGGGGAGDQSRNFEQLVTLYPQAREEKATDACRHTCLQAALLAVSCLIAPRIQFRTPDEEMVLSTVDWIVTH